MAIKIYTAGKMSGLTLEQQMQWRTELEYKLRKFSEVKIEFIHPPLFYNYEKTYHKSEAEIKEWELNKIRECDIVVVNLDGIGSSVGTHFELGFINAMNMFGNKHIYVIGIGDTENLYSWIELSTLRIEPDVDSACQYINDYLLV